MQKIVLLLLTIYFSISPALSAEIRGYRELMEQSGYLSFKSKDGFKVYARLHGPTKLEQPLPAVIELHGGPHNNFSNTPSYLYKTLVDAGFLVLAVNYRGSRGYDSEYYNKIAGDIGGKDVEDVAAAAKELQRLGFAKKNNIFLLPPQPILFQKSVVARVVIFCVGNAQS